MIGHHSMTGSLKVDDRTTNAPDLPFFAPRGCRSGRSPEPRTRRRDTPVEPCQRRLRSRTGRMRERAVTRTEPQRLTTAPNDRSSCDRGRSERHSGTRRSSASFGLKLSAVRTRSRRSVPMWQPARRLSCLRSRASSTRAPGTLGIEHLSQSSACTRTGAADDAVVTPTAPARSASSLLPT